MSYRVKMVLPVVGMLFLFGYVSFAVSRGAQEVKQPLPPAAGELSAVKVVEVRDAAGQVVMSGNVTTRTERDGDVEGVATLSGAGAAGEAELEVSRKKNGATEQELEVKVRGLAAGATYNLFVDGRQVTSFTTGRDGKAELELSDRPSK